MILKLFPSSRVFSVEIDQTRAHLLKENIQQVESQQVLMEGSDLELETVELSRREDSDGSVTVINGTELGLKLSFYDRMPFTPSQSETQEDPDRIDAPS